MDFFDKEGLFSKAKSIVASLYGMLSWTSKLPYPMQTQKKILPTHPAGLKTLVEYSQEEEALLHHQNQPHSRFIIHSYMILSPPILVSSACLSLFRSMTHSSSSSWSSGNMGDLIGSESGVHMMTSNEEETTGIERPPEAYHRNHQLLKRNQQSAVKREFPPPISILSRGGNLPGQRPWKLTRHYVDGRLILTEERVKHHEYFEAIRENGRLILNLVSVNANDDDEEEEEESADLQDLEFNQGENEIQEEEEASQEIDGNSGGSDVDDLEDIKVKVSVSSPMSKSCLVKGSERHGDIRKCFTYTGILPSDFNHHHRNASACMTQSVSAPLAFTSPPMTTVV